jgi:predicted nuclease of predicted toxin-antitoxin system
MRFKLDENFGTRTQHIFETSGHDAQTVRQEALQGSSDTKLFDVCVREQRCLVTLDLDFADVTRFRSVRTAGIVVIRAPRNPSLSLSIRLNSTGLSQFGQLGIDGR